MENVVATVSVVTRAAETARAREKGREGIVGADREEEGVVERRKR